MLGTAFLNNFFVEFAYNVDNVLANNTMKLTVGQYAIPNVYLGDATYE